MTDTQEPTRPAARRVWNFSPDLPLKLSPYWDWPLRPLQSFRYLLDSWKPVRTRFMILISAIVAW